MRVYSLILVFTALSISMLAAQGSGHFHKLSIEDGLSQNFITALLKSRDGDVWIGTQIGLDRFVGGDIRHFRSRRDNPSSLVSAYIYALHEDQSGYIWVGTDRGPCRYDPKTEQFKRIILQEGDSLGIIQEASVHAFIEDRDGNFFINTAEGFFKFDTLEFNYVPIPIADSIAGRKSEAAVGLVYNIDDDRILIGGASGPFIYEPKHHRAYPLRASTEINHSWRTAIDLPGGIFLVGTTQGLIRIKDEDLSRDTLLDYDFFIPSTEEDGAGRHTSDLVYDGNNGFFLASNAGMSHYSWPSASDAPNLLTKYLNDENRANSLASDQTQCLLKVDPHWLWVGTRHGISRLFIGPSPIKAFSLDGEGTPFCSDDIKGMTISSSGRYLIMGGNKGLNIMDLETNEVQCLNQESFPPLRNNYIINVEPGPDYDTYWLCFRRGGADILSGVESGQIDITPGLFKEAGTNGLGTYQIVQSRDDRSWIASGRGLFARDNQSEELTRFEARPDRQDGLPHEYLFSLIEDHRGRIWTGSARAGVARLENEERQSFTVWRASKSDPNSLAHGMILHLFEDDQNRIWCSTPEGISVIWPDDRVSTYTTADGLPSDLVFGVMQDKSQKLWINSTGGLTQAELNAFDDPINIISTFSTKHRLTGGRSQYGWMLIPDGRMVLAGDGLNIFHPDSLPTYEEQVPIKFTGFQLFNQPIQISKEVGSPLPFSLEYIDQLVLAPSQNFPGFDFSSTSILPDPPKTFSYRLIGLQDEWVSTRGRQWVGFPKLPPGRYTLEVRTGEPTDEIHGPINSLSIYLKAPWYRRWWAYGLYLLGIVGLLVLWSTHQKNRQKQLVQLREAEREEFRQRSARDFHDEAGNYLTRIGLLSEVARSQKLDDKNLSDILDKLDTNVQSLREGMRDFIWVIDPANDDAYELFLRLKRFGQELFEHHPALFEVSGLNNHLKNINLPVDQRRHLLMLLKEAMHNTLKHAHSAQKIFLDIKSHQNQLEIIWSDDGPGFDLVDTKFGNGLNNMSVRAQKINAELNLDNRKGCRITLTLPVKLD
ncbi:MAG: two-component regulator propeller domain-containing protein [Bacteroidota bacterium]